VLVAEFKESSLIVDKGALPFYDKEAMKKSWNKVKLQPSDATLDDAKDKYTILLLDKKLNPIQG
jgi:hypothetical protein